jgi:multicomponent Na+:H+ antiporter subunit G
VIDWIVVALIVTGAAFCMIAALGILRLPDLYTRMQASAKSSTMGVSCLIIAATLRMDSLGAATRALLVVAFLFLTVPVAAHMIARAAYASGVPLWSGSILDELKTHGQTRKRKSQNSAPDA